MCVCVRVCACMCICVCMCACECVCVWVSVCVYVCMSVVICFSLFLCADTYQMLTLIHQRETLMLVVDPSCPSLLSLFPFPSTHTHTHTHTNIHTYTHACTHTPLPLTHGRPFLILPFYFYADLARIEAASGQCWGHSQTAEGQEDCRIHLQLSGGAWRYQGGQKTTYNGGRTPLPPHLARDCPQLHPQPHSLTAATGDDFRSLLLCSQPLLLHHLPQGVGLLLCHHSTTNS